MVIGLPVKFRVLPSVRIYLPEGVKEAAESEVGIMARNEPLPMGHALTLFIVTSDA